MYLYLLYVLLVYIRSLSFFLLVCSYTLVNALYRHVLVVCMCCCVSSYLVYAHKVLYFYVVFVFVVSRPSALPSVGVPFALRACAFRCRLACVRLLSSRRVGVRRSPYVFGCGLLVMRSMSADTPQTTATDARIGMLCIDKGVLIPGAGFRYSFIDILLSVAVVYNFSYIYLPSEPPQFPQLPLVS